MPIRIAFTVLLILLTALIVLFSPVSGLAKNDSFFATKLPLLSKEGSLSFEENKARLWNLVNIEEVENKCEWWGDCYLIKFIDTKNNNSIADLRFNSSYGFFYAGFVDLTGDTVEELLLISGKGHGTSVRSEKLSIYQFKNATIEKIYEIPISDYFGPGVRWWYKISFIDDKQNKEKYLFLELDNSPYEGNPIAYPELIPKIKKIKYIWSHSEKKFIEK